MLNPPLFISEKKPLTVSELNRQIRLWLEQDVGEITVTGEISNLAKPSSGHFYFTLKDHYAQVRCVFFRNYRSSTNHDLADGQQVTLQGILSLYEVRGEYQLIVHACTSAGMGLLYQQFIQLRDKLANLGLFAVERKRPIPLYPQAIAVITSPTGAAIRDILTTLSRRYPLAEVLIYPSEVQGKSAASQLVQAITKANADCLADVLILARGGGSIEDLWPFNDEHLAHAIHQSTIPVISGVGHETDFTIADFVADYRAPTPTGAAEAATPDKLTLLEQLARIEQRLHHAMRKILQHRELMLTYHWRTLTSPSHAIANFWQSLDFLTQQLQTHCERIISNYRHRLTLQIKTLQSLNPIALTERAQLQLCQLETTLTTLMHQRLAQAKQALTYQLATLHAVSPLATLDRGYAIVTREKSVLQDSKQLKLGDSITIRLAQGGIEAAVTQIWESTI